MQDTAAIYRFEFRGTIEIPTQVLLQHREGTLQQAIALCDEYGCQIVLKDLADTLVSRGVVKPDGKYELT